MDRAKPDHKDAIVPKATCIHCGLPVPQGLLGETFNTQDPNRLFCCSGCAFVYDTIHGHGLDEFYGIRDSLGIKQGVKAQVKDSKYAYMDSDSFGLAHLETRPSGLSFIRFYLSGVHCAACVWVVERLPRILDGVISAKLNLALAQVEITYDPNLTHLSVVASTLNSLGYSPHVIDSVKIDLQRQKDERRMFIRLGVAGLAAGNVMLFAISLYEGSWSGISPEYSEFFHWASMLVALPAVLYSAFPFYNTAFKGLMAGVLHLDLPIAVGIIGGYALSAFHTVTASGEVYYDSVCMLIFLLLIGRFLQQRAVNSSLAKIDALPSFLPNSAQRKNAGGTVEEVYSKVLAVGDRVILTSGEVLAADGKVVEGGGLCSFAVITGESKAKQIGLGDSIPAGARLVNGLVELELISTAGASRISQMLCEVKSEAGAEPPLAELTDRVGTVFVLAVSLLGSFTFWWWSADGVDVALNATLALIVISCPCALALAVPLTMSMSLGRAASKGFFVRGASVLERLAAIESLYFDKTGTLTFGEPRVINAYWVVDNTVLRPWSEIHSAKEREYAACIRALERGVAHPAAEALNLFLRDIPSDTINLDTDHIQGMGITSVGAENWLLGSQGLLESKGIRPSQSIQDVVDSLETTLQTPVFLVRNNSIKCVFGISDSIKVDALKTIDLFKASGLNLGILSGDRQAIVNQIALELGIDEQDVIGEQLPLQKREHIERNKLKGLVAMVGDGLNDADALVAADVGIGIHGGAEACLKNSDVFVASGRIGDVYKLWLGARRSIAVIRGALWFSLAYNLVGASLAMCGYIGPLVAAVAMPLSSLTVVGMASLRRTF